MPKICLVEATLIERRNKVVIKRMDGNDEKSKGCDKYSDINNTNREILIFKVIKTSMIQVGKGMIMILIIISSKTANKISEKVN